MDWRRAVIILIISFIALNVILAANLWLKERPVEEFVLTPDQQREIEAQLSEKGIRLEAKIPSCGVPQAFLELGYNKVDAEKVVENFLGKGANPSTELIQGGRSYATESKQLIIMDNGIITYFNRSGDSASKGLSREEAESKALEFMRSHGGLPKEAVLNSVTYDDKTESFLIEFVRKYDGFFVANSYIDILVSPSGVKNYYQSWLNIYGYKGKKRAVISPLTAILRMASEKNNDESMVITGVEQGFYSKFYDAERWQAAPVWKIKLESGDVYYVNAYTGELEQ
ncbi:MAG: two-component system regulatory protein YycI [Tepidanaerobacteraceae bacterium]|nr:two-component system regulatory protein YycI [Tepidanaerobacteraceae bacterium]